MNKTPIVIKRPTFLSGLARRQRVIKRPIVRVMSGLARKRTVIKRPPVVSGFAYELLVEYKESRLFVQKLVATNIIDLYKDYLFFISNLPDEKKKKNGLENIPKQLNIFFNQALNGNPKIIGLIPKRRFGALVESLLQDDFSNICLKRSKVLQSVGLKSAEGVVFVNELLRENT